MPDDHAAATPEPDPGQPPETVQPAMAGAGQTVPAAAAAQTLDPKVGAMLSYLLFGWVGGLIMFFTQKHPEVRFHAAQSIIVFGAYSAVSVFLSFLVPTLMFSGLGGLFLFSLLNFALGVAAFVLWIMLSIKGYNLEHYKLPIAGDMAERWANAPQ